LYFLDSLGFSESFPAPVYGSFPRVFARFGSHGTTASYRTRQCRTVGTIIARKRKDGSVGYTAQILIKRKGVIIYREAQTFDRKQAAGAWLKRRETELAKPGALEKKEDPPLRDVIDRYLSESEKKVGKTKSQVLRSIKGYDISEKKCSEIESADIVAFAQSLGSKPQTRQNYLSHLSAIFAIAKPAWGYPLNREAIRDAMTVTKRLGVTSKGGTRNRRPSLIELDRLMEHFGSKRSNSLPMQKIVAFALFSTRRQEEITRISWEDLDAPHSRVLVRDMKHPGDKAGNDTWCELPSEALSIAQSMPRKLPEIFPFSTDAISAAFTRACKMLEIEDLHFHDLRHEGVSRLFEMGRTIPQTASVSGHRSWASLKRYSHIREAGDKYADWKWLSVVTA
jgi:integrase